MGNAHCSELGREITMTRKPKTWLGGLGDNRNRNVEHLEIRKGNKKNIEKKKMFFDLMIRQIISIFSN